MWTFYCVRFVLLACNSKRTMINKERKDSMKYTVENAQKDINILKEAIRKIEDFVKVAESYPEDIPEQKAIKYYAHCGRVVEVANRLNEEGYRVGNRKWTSNDVSDIIDQPSKDDFLKILRKNHTERERFQKVVWK